MLLSLRHALRRLRRSPGFTFLAVGMLALGIGFSACTFSVANFILLRSMPYPDGERLMRLFRVDDTSDQLTHSSGTYLDIRASTTTLEGIAAYYHRQLNVALPGEPPVQESGLGATADFFNVLGVQPFLGRGFTPEEDQPGEASDVILAHSYWMRQFGGDPDILGQVLRVGEETYTIVGVLPPFFEMPQIWGPKFAYVIPTTMWPNSGSDWTRKYFSIIARLKLGVPVEQAQSELDTIALRLSADHPAEVRNDRLRITDLYTAFVSSETRRIVWLVTALAVLVLMIACANLAGVQLARAFAQSQEFATRAALGASRRDLVLPPLLESLFLTVGGGIVGAWVGYAGNQYLSREFADAIPIDVRVILFAFAVTVLTGLAFGLAPAMIAAGRTTSEGLKDSARGATGGRKHQTFKKWLVMGQLALALVLVSAAATFAFAARLSMQREVGWQPGNLSFAMIRVPYGPYPDEEHKRPLFRTLREKLTEIPGVTGATLAMVLPVYGYYWEPFVVEGAAPVPPGQEPETSVNYVDPGYFTTLAIRFREGDTFPAPRDGDPPLQVIVNETMAHQIWPDESALGKRLRLQRFIEAGVWFEVVGVVGDVEMPANFGPMRSRLQLYMPMEYLPGPFFNLIMTSPLEPEALIPPMREVLSDINQDIIVYDANGIAAWMRQILEGNNLLISILTAFALAGLFIALIGLYGIMSQITNQRTREMGIRIALGATSRDIVRLVLVQAGFLILAGSCLGVAGAFAVNIIYRASYPGLPLPGGWLQVIIAFVLCLAGLGAAYLPARRVGRTNPVSALRAE